MVEYSAFNRLVLGSSPRQPNHINVERLNLICEILNLIKKNLYFWQVLFDLGKDFT